ncbi:hypothetical protein ACIGB8_24020 [Promicromonospora sukumoe]|uniref:hypothetical protein n=1 Tax=Promicromonospora sukumoe TaxID=88382 RepID=UPI0037C95B96
MTSIMIGSAGFGVAPRARGYAEHGAASWRTSSYSANTCVQAKPLDAVLRYGTIILDEAEQAVVKDEHVGTLPEPKKEQLRPRAPWYVKHGMLGELTVAGVLRWPVGAAQLAAHESVAGFGGRIEDPAVAALVETKIAELLANNDPAVWDKRLERGEMHVAGDHLVWVRPELAEMIPAEEVDAAAVRKYEVRFATTTSATEQNRSTSSGLDALLFTAFNLASSAASAQGIGVPLLAADASTSHSRTVTTSVITGTKLFVDQSSRFVSGVRFRLFVDGVEVEGEPRTVNRAIAVDLPTIFTSSDEPRPRLTVPAQSTSPGANVHARPLMGDEVLHAVDLTPLVAREQARLRRAGLSADMTRSIVAQVQDVLNERNARNNSRWWLTTGSISREITSGPDSPLLRRIRPSFKGHFRVVATLDSIQRLGTTDRVSTRADLGGARGLALRDGGSSAAAMTIALNTSGVSAPLPEPTTDLVRTTGVAPLVGVTVSRSREWNRRLSSQPVTHTVLNTTAPQTRYRSLLAIEVVWESSNHRTLRRHPSLTTLANSDIGVPTLGSRGAADFEERVVGAVRDKDAQAADAVSAMTVAPNGPGPHVLALPRETRRLRHTTPVRPATLHPEYRPRRSLREPLALASRKGLGFAVGSTLPGSELVAEHFRTRLEQLVEERGITGVNWAAVHRTIVVNFGTPRLEGDPDGLLAGIKHTVRIGDRQVTMHARLHLTDSLATTHYPGVTNTRAAVDESVVGGAAKRWALQGTLGGALRVTVPWARIQASAVRVVGRFFRSQGEQFGTGTETYRRVENIGREDEHTIDAVYESSLYVEGDRNLRPERWWTHDSANVVAKVLVPYQHVPQRPVQTEETQRVGRLAQATRAWPEAPHLDLTAGTAGLYPAFLTLPVLARTTADLYARLHGLSRTWVENEVHWPSEILDLASPTWHAARLGMLAGRDGYTFDLPDRAGWQTTVQVRMRAYAPRQLPTDGETEIEQYSKAAQHHIREREHGRAFGVQVALGPQFRAGSDAAREVESVGDDDFHRGAESSREEPGARAVLLAHGGIEASWKVTAQQKTGFLDITRATYSGPKEAFRADPVFQITVTRTRGERADSERERRYLRFDSALDLLAPPRRAEDVAPRDLHAAKLIAPVGPRAYVDPGLPRTSAHAERLLADGVLDAIERHLTQHGALRSQAGRGRLADPLRRSLEAVYRSDALLAQMPNLLTSGAWVWLPVKGFAGATYYLWVRVTIDRVDPAHSQRPRPEVKLTLRGESLHETEEGRVRGLTVLGGAAVVARAGSRSAETHEHGHGGVDARAGRLLTRESTVSKSTKSVDIYRLGTRDEQGSYEFEHNVGFRVETAMSYDPPEIVAVLGEAISTLTRGARLLTHRLANVATSFTTLLPDPATSDLARPSTRPRLRSDRTWWLWRENEGVEGEARLLVPYHMTAAVAAQAEFAAPFRRSFGQNARWETTDVEPQQLPPEFLEHFHPGDVNADAINRWAWLAAVRTVRAPDLEDHAVDERAGIDVPARSGLDHVHDMAYLHDTSHGAVRPRVVGLLTREYLVHVGTEVVKVGFELTSAREFFPDQEVRNKSRRYQQTDTATESSRSRSSGWFASLGPEGGGGSADHAFLGRMPYEHQATAGEKQSASDSTTHETNQEGTRRFRYFAFDVTLVAQATRAHRRTLKVDVPDGLVGALPLEGDRLVGGLQNSLAWLLPQPRAPRGAATLHRPLRSSASSSQHRLEPVAEVSEEEEPSLPIDQAEKLAVIEEPPALVRGLPSRASSEHSAAGPVPRAGYAQSDSGPSVEHIARVLLSAGGGASAYVEARFHGRHGTTRALRAVNVRGRVRWFDERSRALVDVSALNASLVRSVEMDRHGMLLDPETGTVTAESAARRLPQLPPDRLVPSHLVPGGVARAALPHRPTRAFGGTRSAPVTHLDVAPLAPYEQASTVPMAAHDGTEEPIIWRPSSYSDGKACVSATVLVLRRAGRGATPTRQPGTVHRPVPPT